MHPGLSLPFKRSRSLSPSSLLAPLEISPRLGSVTHKVSGMYLSSTTSFADTAVSIQVCQLGHSPMDFKGTSFQFERVRETKSICQAGASTVLWITRSGLMSLVTTILPVTIDFSPLARRNSRTARRLLCPSDRCAGDRRPRLSSTAFLNSSSLQKPRLKHLLHSKSACRGIEHPCPAGSWWGPHMFMMQNFRPEGAQSTVPPIRSVRSMHTLMCAAGSSIYVCLTRGGEQVYFSSLQPSLHVQDSVNASITGVGNAHTMFQFLTAIQSTLYLTVHKL